MTNLRGIIFDFDGVLVESNDIRTEGFRKLLMEENFPPLAVEELVEYHKRNGGLSRYHKIRYFFEHILGRETNASQLNLLCSEFSRIVKRDVTESPWVKGALEFLKANGSRFSLFIISGSDQSELRDICQARGVDGYFKEILGSPTDKKTNLVHVMERHHLNPKNVVFVGDSVNDWEAAAFAHIPFIMRNSGGAEDLCSQLSAMKDLTELSQRLSLIEGGVF